MTIVLSPAEKEVLRAHIITGATLVQYGDRRVQYGSVEEMIKLWEYIAASEAAALTATGQGRQKVSYVTFSRR